MLQNLKNSDELVFKINNLKITDELLNGQKVPTKREFLSMIMSIFDPLGLK